MALQLDLRGAGKAFRFSCSDPIVSWAKTSFPGEQEIVACYVGSLLTEILGLPVQQMHPLSRFTEDLDATDLEPVEIVMGLEHDLGWAIPPEDFKAIETLGDLVSYIHHRVAQSTMTQP